LSIPARDQPNPSSKQNKTNPKLAAALGRVRAGADIMPASQLHAVLNSELGPAWRTRLADFGETPVAAASIGQVHAATLKNGTVVAMKVQYPGVADSIVSDVDNLLRLVALTGALPRGAFVEAAAAVAKKELAAECDYLSEAAAAERYGALLSADDGGLGEAIAAPAVVRDLTSRRVLTTTWAAGVPIDALAGDASTGTPPAPQAVRDAAGAALLRLTLRELFEWRFMQTDPNWGNFLYDVGDDPSTPGVLTAIDFGACREFSPAFVEPYRAMVVACALGDAEAVLARSTELGFLTGDEAPVMLDAHVAAAMAVGRPFGREGGPGKGGLFDFGGGAALTADVRDAGGTMLSHRLVPPPEEAYSLHRRLSGAFLACIKLGARVPARELLAAQLDRCGDGAAAAAVRATGEVGGGGARPKGRRAAV
jgi:aarF domain-containing kinase